MKVTQRGKPAAPLTALEKDELNDLILEHSPKVRKMVASAEKARQREEVVSLEDYLKSR